MIPNQLDDHWFVIGLGTAARVIEAGLSFACAYAAVMVWSQGQAQEPGAIILIFTTFVLAFALNLIMVFLHEMGHALAAWSVKRRVHLICVGWLAYAPGVRKIMWVRSPANAEYAGFVQCSPVWPDLSTRKSIWISLGGPLITFVTGVTILLLARGAETYSLPIYMLAAFFLMDAVVNLMPLKWSPESASDGLHIWQYMTGNLWTPDSWAETRLGLGALSDHVVSDDEWRALRPLVKQPFMGGANFRRLLYKAATQKNDTEMMYAMHPWETSKAP